jgi:hypothetical protein
MNRIWKKYGNNKKNMGKPYDIQSKHVFDIHRIH